MNKRSYALDAVRGLAIIGMVFSGTVADSLPSWMYHAQVGPRSNMSFNPSFVGITWVDLVFPFFLFAMGAAFPLALGRKLDKGNSVLSLFPTILKRVFLLVLFAISIYHCTPYRLSGSLNYELAILAFILFFASFVRLPTQSDKKNSILNWTGISLLIALIAFNVLSQSSVFSQGFKLSHNDIIILVLANMALFGAIAWIFTRSNIVGRLGIMAFFFAFRLSSGVEGSWNQAIWNFNPAMFLPENIQSTLYISGNWLYRMDFLKYLLIVLPGTIVGDLLVKWMADTDNQESTLPSKPKMWALLFLMLGIVLSNLICLFSRYLELNIILNLLFAVIGLFLLRNPKHSLSRLYFRLNQWGISWLLLGNVFEAFEGGIRKDQATMSYFFVTVGLAIFTLIFFSVVIDFFHNNRLFKYIVESGQNPMLAYVAGTFVVVPILVFTGLMPYINKVYEITPWFGVIKAIVITSGMMIITVITVRKKWFWKT